MQAEGPFTADDFAQVGALALATWHAGVDADWSVPAGTLEWSRHKAAEHVIDSALAPAFFLASRRRLYAATVDYPRDEITRTDDSWSDLLASRGRPRP